MADLNNAPETVTVVFPRADFGVLTDQYHAVVIEQFPGSHAIDPPRTQLIHDTAIANFMGGVLPLNDAQLNALAAKIAGDFYAWRLGSVEIRYETAVPWTQDGLHDVEYQHEKDIATFVHRSMWEPENGVYRQTGDYGSSDLPPGITICLPRINACTGQIQYERFYKGKLISVDSTNPCPECSKPPSGSGSGSGSGGSGGDGFCCSLGPNICVTFVNNSGVTELNGIKGTLAFDPSMVWIPPGTIDVVPGAWRNWIVVPGCPLAPPGSEFWIGVSFGCNPFTGLYYYAITWLVMEAGQGPPPIGILGVPDTKVNSSHCSPDFQAIATGNLGNGCTGGFTNATATFTDGACTFAPAVDVSTDNICSDSGTVFDITGSAFTSPFGSNTVTLTDSGAVNITNTVTAGDATHLTVQTTMPISNLGALDGSVTNANGTSATVQVATVISCASFIWYDTFTDTNGTALTSHTPEIGTFYASDFTLPSLSISANHAISTSFGPSGGAPGTGNSGNLFSPGHIGDQTGSVTISLGLLNTNAIALDVTNNSNTKVFLAIISHNANALPFVGAADTLYICDYDIAGGTFNPVASVACPVSLNTEYLLTLQDVGGVLTATLNGHSCNFNTGEALSNPLDWYIEIYSTTDLTPPDPSTYFDTLKVQ